MGSKNLGKRWYTVVNDLVGGWAVSIIDAPLSQQDQRHGRTIVAETADEETAKYIAGLHNERPAAAGQPDGFMRFTGMKLSELEAPEVEVHETVGSESWQRRWMETLTDVVQYEDPWGLVGMRPDGDYHLFDADQVGIWRCAVYPSVRVWLLFPEWAT